MVFADQQGQVAVLAGNPQAGVDGFHQRQPQGLMTIVMGPVVPRCHALADVVNQRRVAHHRVVAQAGGLLDHLQHMVTGIDFRVVFFRLWYAEQAVHFRQQYCQCTACAQAAEKRRRAGFPQRRVEFLPDPLGNQVFQFAGLHQLCHQGQGLVGNPEAARGKAGRKPGHPQHP